MQNQPVPAAGPNNDHSFLGLLQSVRADNTRYCNHHFLERGGSAAIFALCRLSRRQRLNSGRRSQRPALPKVSPLAQRWNASRASLAVW